MTREGEFKLNSLHQTEQPADSVHDFQDGFEVVPQTAVIRSQSHITR